MAVVRARVTANRKVQLTTQLTIVVSVNDREILQQNLLASPWIRSPHGHEILIQEHYSSAALAYNDAMRKASHELIAFVHQDVFFPNGWLSELDKALGQLEVTDPDWGVLGCWGAQADGRLVGHIYSSGLGVLGGTFDSPLRIQTLDEIVLIVKKSSRLSFDETLPHFHFYGTDICMRAADRGLNCYAISAFCIHNTKQLLRLPKEFYGCYTHIKRLLTKRLPIQTTCIRISRLNGDVYRRKLEDFCRPAFLDRRRQAFRVPNPAEILKTLGYSRWKAGEDTDILSPVSGQIGQ